jgi:glutathione peroxidase-family protein
VAGSFTGFCINLLTQPAPPAALPARRCCNIPFRDCKTINRSRFASTGKVLLVVNTASYCGFTGQYAGLEALYARHKDQGLVVLGFPSNDFKQETGSNQQIGAFCQNTFGVKFPMFAKSSVKGRRRRPFTDNWPLPPAKNRAGTSIST